MQICLELWQACALPWGACSVTDHTFSGEPAPYGQYALPLVHLLSIPLCLVTAPLLPVLFCPYNTTVWQPEGGTGQD